MSVITDHRDWFGDSFGRSGPVCRGNGLTTALRELREGVRSNVSGVVGGFSGYGVPCKRFASRFPGGKPDFPTVTLMSKAGMAEQGLKPVEYEESWLRDHPLVLEHIQTLHHDRGRSFEDKLSSAMTYKAEAEWVAEGRDRVEIPDYRQLNVYVSPREVETLMGKRSMWGQRQGEFCRIMDEAADEVRRRIERELPGDTTVDATTNVAIYACHDTMNLNDEKGSACVLHSTFRPGDSR